MWLITLDPWHAKLFWKMFLKIIRFNIYMIIQHLSYADCSWGKTTTTEMEVMSSFWLNICHWLLQSCHDDNLLGGQWWKFCQHYHYGWHFAETKSALVQWMTLHCIGNKPLPEPILVMASPSNNDLIKHYWLGSNWHFYMFSIPEDVRILLILHGFTYEIFILKLFPWIEC